MVHANQGLFRALRGKRPIYSICQTLTVGTPVNGAPCSYLEWCLEHAGHAVTALTKKLCLKSNLASLAIHYPLEALQWHSSSALNLLYSCWSLGFIFRWGRSPDCQGVSVLYKWESERQWGLPQPSGEPKFLDPRGLIYDLPPSAFHCLNHRVNPFRIAQLSVQRITARAYEWLPAKPLEFSPLAV